MRSRSSVLLVGALVMLLGCGKASRERGAAELGGEAGASGSAEAGASDGAGAGGSAGAEAGASEKTRAGGSAGAGTGTGVRKLSLDAKEIAAIFEKIPRLAELAADLRLYSEPYDVNVVRKRGSEDVSDYVFSANPVLWTPAGGKPHLVITGKSKKDAFVVALERLPNGGYELASSLVFRNDPGPFVLAYQPYARERLLWTSCWKCSGEGGAIVARDAGQRVVVIQQ